MLDELGKNLSGLIKNLAGKGSVDEKTISKLLSDIKKTLLQSDVDTELTDRLVSNIEKKVLNEKTPAGMTLREHVIKTIYDELVRFLGESPSDISDKKRIMLIGLFGSGKTTTAAKLARYFKKKGKRPVLVALDYHRPAAPQQLSQLGEKLKVPVHIDENKDPINGSKESLEKFKKQDVIIFDTAGRNALDEELANELKNISSVVNPDEVLLAIPADIGKVAKKQAEEFNKLVGITGIIVTKMDGTAKAGGALAAASATKAKVKFIGTGENPEDFEVYNPERFVSRLLGLGDLETLLEKAKESGIKEETVENIVEGRFTLKDFYEQIEAMQNMGPLGNIVGMIPGAGNAKIPKDLLEKQDQKMRNYKHIINSMTEEEKIDPEIINSSRIKRIAKGSGRPESDVRELLAQYKKMKKVMKMMGGAAGMKRGSMKNLAKQFGFKM